MAHPLDQASIETKREGESQRVRVQGRGRRSRDDGRRDRPGHRLRGHSRGAEGHQAGVRRCRSDEGPGGHARAARQPRQQAEDHRRAGRRAGDRDPRAHHRHDGVRGLRRRRLRHRGRARADGDQAGRLRRARHGHARARDPRLEHLLAVDQRDGRRDIAPWQGRRLSLLLSGLHDAPRRDHRGRRHRCGDDAGRDDVRPDDPQAADRLRRGARLRRQPHPQLGDQ